MSKVKQSIATDAKVAQEIDNMTHAEIEIATVSPETLAAKDVRVLDVIENLLMNYAHNPSLTDELVLNLQSYLQDESQQNSETLLKTARTAKMVGVMKLVQQVKNSPEFLKLVSLKTPDEDIPLASADEFVKGEVIAVGTTATEVVSSKAETPTTPKPSKGSKATKAPKSAKKAKETPKLPMPKIASIAELEALASDRRGLIKAVQAVKSNNPDITLRANAATVELTKLLAKEVLGVDYKVPQKPTKAPKATKGNATPLIKKEDIDLATLTWEDCKNNMSYRQLQQVCGALKLQKLFSGNCGGKGATKDNFLKGIAGYFKSQGVDIVEVKMSPATEIKPLALPNLEKAFADRAAQQLVAA